MAITKSKKNEILDQYKRWLSESKSVILVEYTGSTMQDMEKIRASIRDTGGEFHVVKNTLVKLAFEASGLGYKFDPHGLTGRNLLIGLQPMDQEVA